VLVVGAATPAGVVDELPGTVVGGSPQMPAQYRVTSPPEVVVETYVANLVVPWALAFAPDGRLFVSERPGRIRVAADGALEAEPWATLQVRASGEGGLMGLALDPDFPTQPWVYVCYTITLDNAARNRISRLREVDGRGQQEQILLDAFPGASVHRLPAQVRPGRQALRDHGRCRLPQPLAAARFAGGQGAAAEP
jgi:glucose/arabinose dehydrogenase